MKLLAINVIFLWTLLCVQILENLIQNNQVSEIKKDIANIDLKLANSWKNGYEAGYMTGKEE